MSPIISAYYEDEHNRIRSEPFKVNSNPDYCPFCHQGIEPIKRFGWFEDGKLYAIFQCPKKICRFLFIGIYSELLCVGGPTLETVYELRGCMPKKVKKKVFHDGIMNISSKFSIIYNQAKEAEERKLKEICGAGYRKALEFLIKDYLIKEKNKKREVIEKTPLGTCIKDHIDSQNIKDCAKRAAWLGNDETHYIREWKDKDLEDLKDLIELTVNWIRDEYLTRRIKKDMPEEKAKAKEKGLSPEDD